MGKNLTTQEFLDKAIKIHSEEKYDYSKTVYKDFATKCIFICKKHGEFELLPHHFLKQKNPCKECAKENRKDRRDFTTSSYIEAATAKFDGKYSYEKTIFTKMIDYITVTCPIHGDFTVTAGHHLTSTFGCKQCSHDSQKITLEKFLKRARAAHGDKYNYDKVVIEDIYNPITITCPIHGDFVTDSNHHLNHKRGCKMCAIDKTRKSNDQYIKDAKAVHGDLYDYSLCNYKSTETEISIICKEHGVFKQLADSHLHKKQGCPKCNASMQEKDIMKFLEENGITYEFQKRLKELGRQSLDFYLPKYNVGIECQGKHHFEESSFFEKNSGKFSTKEFDRIKANYCKGNGIRLLYYSNLKMEFPYQVFTDKNELLQEIKKGE